MSASSPTDPLRAARAGERWVLRVRLADSSATDLVGFLDRVTASYVHVALPDGRQETVDRSEVIAARRAPAAVGGPPPSRVSADELERHALPGWLALHQPLGEWTLRAGGGFTGRANSCLAVGDPGRPMADAAAAIVAHARSEGIAPMAQVVAGGEPEAALRSLGWRETYVATDVLAVRLADFLADRARDPRVRVSETLEVPWWDAYGHSRPNDADPALLRMILDGRPPRAFAGVAAEDDPCGTRHLDHGDLVAIGRGHLDGDWLGLASVWTAADHRRRGWATLAMTALGHWAARRGARYAYLQVASANEAARTAYERLGFTRHHSYRYLAPTDVP